MSMLRISYRRILRVLEKTLRYVNKSAEGGGGGLRGRRGRSRSQPRYVLIKT